MGVRSWLEPNHTAVHTIWRQLSTTSAPQTGVDTTMAGDLRRLDATSVFTGSESDASVSVLKAGAFGFAGTPASNLPTFPLL